MRAVYIEIVKLVHAGSGHPEASPKRVAKVVSNKSHTKIPLGFFIFLSFYFSTM